MRVTNGILMNNSLSNINTNKVKMDTLNTQLTSQKKIQRPSDDPIVAIRALRFRSTLAEIDQYLEKNIPDASAWMECTDEALGNIVDLLGDITEYCNQAVNGYYDETNKNTIVENLKAFRDQIFGDANADCAGRTIFTGYKTDSTLTFTKDNTKKFEITEKFDKKDLDVVNKVTNSLDISGIDETTLLSVDVDSIKIPENVQSYRLRLAYDDLTPEDGLEITVKNPDSTITTTSMNSTDLGAYEPGADEVYYLADTGELIIGSNVYAELNSSESFEFTYTKEGYKKGELDPSQYFDCVDITDEDNAVTYTSKNQEINYEVNFNQVLKINTQGKDVFTQDMTRDLDEMINAVNKVIDITAKKENLQKLYDNSAKDSEEREKAKKLLDICERELDFANENLENSFSKGLTQYQKHQDFVSLARSDVGSRQKRLELNESRLEAQKTTVKNLKSINEDANTVNVAIELKEASSVYDASLAAAAKVVQNKLLDFL